MYLAKRGDDVLYILDKKPTKNQLEDMGCDSCIKHTPEESEDARTARITQLAITLPIEEIESRKEDFVGVDKDTVILQRFFGGDRGKEIGFTQDFAYLLAKTERTKEEEEKFQRLEQGYLEKKKLLSILQ